MRRKYDLNIQNNLYFETYDNDIAQNNNIKSDEKY